VELLALLGKLCNFGEKVWHEDGNERMLLLTKSDKTGLNCLLICWQNRITFFERTSMQSTP
jgi:hypothetical protein